SPESLDELYYFVRKAAGGLAALHSSKAHYGEVVTWADRVPDVRKIVDRLVVPIPELASAVMPLLDRLEALDAAQPAGAPVPAHGTFKPEQVLIHGRQIGLIDFDEFCMAEPALDIAVFLAAIKDVGLTSDDTLQSAPLRQERLALLASIGEAFLEEYARRAPLSRERVALWEALEYINDVLDCWIKVKPAEVTPTMLILKHHLRRMEL
ncbi:MAG TPA: phosphotransferase, partial [Anaerolineales bacterium]|nr:phosphotransferase [Anaerolineales bacterium]